MAEFENTIESGPSDFNEYEDEQVAELEDTDDWGMYFVKRFKRLF